MIIKYKVEKTFIDKNTKETVSVNSIIDIDINRMRELNEKNVGRVVDIIESTLESNGEILENDEMEKKQEDKKEIEETEKKRYTMEELEAMKVDELKKLAEKEKYELTKATKKEIIQEILELQEK